MEVFFHLSFCRALVVEEGEGQLGQAAEEEVVVVVVVVEAIDIKSGALQAMQCVWHQRQSKYNLVQGEELYNRMHNPNLQQCLI